MRRFHSSLMGVSALASVSTIALAAALGVAPAAALAAEAPAAVSGDNTTSAGEVVVTATKRAEPVKTVPDAITVLPARQLQVAGVSELRDLNGLVPGLVVSGGIASGEFVIRGLSTGNDASPVTGLQIDGAPIGSVTYGAAAASTMPEIDPSLISRIEVLKGPQGTLYGGSTLGGIVQFVTKKPSLDQIQGAFTVEGSSTEHGGGNSVVRGAIGGPIVQGKLGFQLSAYDDDLGGFIDDPKLGRDRFNAHQSYGGRASLLWQVNPDFQIQLSDIYSHLHSYSDLVLYNATTHRPANGDLVYNAGTLPVSDSNFNMVSLNGTYDLHWATLSYIGTYQTFHSLYASPYDTSPITTIVETDLPLFGGPSIPANSSLGVFDDSRTSKWTSELRLASPDSERLRWLVGVFYNKEQSAAPLYAGVVEPNQMSAPAPLGSLLYYDLFTHLTEVAGFADVTYFITPQLDVTGGIRVGHIDQDYRQLSSGSDFAALNTLDGLFGLLPSPPDTGLRTATETFETYLANVRYHLTANSMVYFRFATGFRPGGPNDDIPGLPATFAPDTTKDYEVGWKTSYWGGRGYLDVSAYYIDWNNIQIATEVDGLAGETNGGAAVSQGVEATTTLNPVAGLSLTASAAYGDAHLTENVPGGLGNKGDTLPNAPKWTGALGASYAWSLDGDWRPYVGGQVRYVDSRHYAFVHSLAFADYVLPAYTVVDLQAGVRHGRYDLQVFARNLGDDRAQLGDVSLGANYIVVSRPRTIGAALSVDF